MDTYRAFLAIVISFVILLGYQYFFVGFDQPVAVDETNQQTANQPVTTAAEAPQPAAPITQAQPAMQAAQSPSVQPVAAPAYDREPKMVDIDTDLYSAILSEDGGTITSFILKKYKETNKKDSPGVQLVKTDASQGFPLQFSWGSAVGPKVLYNSDVQNVTLSDSAENAVIRLQAEAGNGLMIERVYTFHNNTYLVDLSIRVKNISNNPLQGIAQLGLVNAQFEGVSSPAKRFLFAGPVAYVNGELIEVKPKELEEGPKTLQGTIDYALAEMHIIFSHS